MIIIHLKNEVEICFPNLQGDRLIPYEEHLEICLHDSPSPTPVQCTCDPEDLKLYMRQSGEHLIIQNNIIKGVEAITPDSKFMANLLAVEAQPNGFSLN